MSSCKYTKLLPPTPSKDIESDDPETAVYPTKTEALQHRSPRKTRSCLKTCLLVTLILFGLLFGLLFAIPLAAGVWAYRWTAGNVRKWTVTQPQTLPIIPVPNEELDIFKDQAKLFFDLIQADQVPEDFVVTATNLNGLAASSDYLRGNAYIEMKTNQVVLNLSLPMDFLPGGKGRFLVGTETVTWDPNTSIIKAKMEPLDNENVDVYYDMEFHFGLTDDGRWILTILSGQFLDWTVPQDFIDENYNLLEDLYDCDDDDDDHCKVVRKVVEALDEVSLENDQVVFHAGPKSAYGNRVLAEAEKWSSNYKPSWMLQLVRRLAF